MGDLVLVDKIIKLEVILVLFRGEWLEAGERETLSFVVPLSTLNDIVIAAPGKFPPCLSFIVVSDDDAWVYSGGSVSGIKDQYEGTHW